MVSRTRVREPLFYVLFGFMSIFFKTKKREAKMVAPNTYGDASQKAAKQVLSSFFGTIATASLILVGSSAAFNIAGKQIVKSNKKRLGKKCTLCDGLRFISCGTCKGKGAIEWQPIKNPEMERVCVCPTCSGTKMSKCLRCVGVGYL